MIGRLDLTVVDCPDPQALAAFHSALLGLPVVRDDPGWVELGHPPGPRLAFQLAPDFVPPTWPAPGVPQQMHLDVEVPEIEAAHEAALALGARYLHEGPTNFRVYLDPAGHPFCLCWPRENVSP